MFCISKTLHDRLIINEYIPKHTNDELMTYFKTGNMYLHILNERTEAAAPWK